MKRILKPIVHTETTEGLPTRKPRGRPRKLKPEDPKNEDPTEREVREYIDYTETLNDAQYKFFCDFVTRIKSKQYGMYLLGAPAGSGKTYTITQLVHYCRTNCISSAVLAPTHKACSLFRPPIHAETICKYMNLRGNYDEYGNLVFFENSDCTLCGKTFLKFDPNQGINMIDEIAFRQHVMECNENNSKKKTTQPKDKVIIVDECSMLSCEMLNVFKMFSKKSLILFTGDVNQIPPVNYEYSPIFEFGHHICKYEFTEIMRTKDDVIRMYSDAFKEAIYTKRKIPTTTAYIDPKHLMDKFKNKEDVVVLSWTNNEKSRYNALIRRALFVKSSNDVLRPYYVGEKLLFSGYRCPSEEVKYIENNEGYEPYIRHIVEDEVKYNTPLGSMKYYSNDIITIKQIGEIEKTIPYINNSNKRITEENIQFWVLTDEYNVKWYRVKDESLDKWKKLVSHFKKFILSLRPTERKYWWRSFYAMTNLLHADLDYTYSITTHKSQGSQWSNVVVNIDNIRRCFGMTGDKLSYTAVTRATKNLNFI